MNHYMATTNFVHPGGAGFKKDQVYEMDEAEGRKMVDGGMMRQVYFEQIKPAKAQRQQQRETATR